MDPDTNLKEQLHLAKEILSPVILGYYEADLEYLAERAEELAQRVLDLDQWIRRRGFLPKPWRR